MEQLYELKTNFTKEILPLIYTYKDFSRPVFYAGPKYNFIKESSLNLSQKELRKLDEADIR